MAEQARPAISSALEAFYQRELAHPDKTYLVQPLGDGSVVSYSWAQVGDQARRMAAYLRSLQFPASSHIALLSRNCAHWIIADLAIWMAGHVSVPVYPTLTADSVRQVLEHSDCRAVFVGKLENWQQLRGGLPEQLPWIALPLGPEDAHLLPWQSLIDANEPWTQTHRVAPTDVATIIYTSGTSGIAKGVMLSFASMYYAANNGLRLFTISEDDRLLSYLPLSNVAERQFVEIASLLSGQTVYFVHSAQTFVEDNRRARPTVFFGVPRIWFKLQQSVLQKVPAGLLNTVLATPLLGPRVARRVLERLGFDQIRYAVSGAAPIDDQLLLWYHRLGMSLVEIYGMTENAGYSHLGRPKRFKSGWIGLPNPGVECRLSGDGELLVRSPANMLGYYKDPVRTAETLDEHGFLHTGDCGAIDNEGFLRITGRRKDTFKTSKGRYVAPAPIEKRLHAHPYIEQACVVGTQLPQPIALIQLSSASIEGVSPVRVEESLSAALLELNGQLNRQEQLACVVVISDAWTVENGFLTPTLKLKRHVVEATYQDQLEYWSVSGRTVVVQ
ncbi:Long-chain acyl-CoA synthetase (AMP-forming) [Halopseudomonas xinjiangensis]|uniref:Long-chain acyl-CoA synthetase (AMP-forming) n=1 Tax=Halopseudomonas xinjiangensis TaxID=487184 RepID=A0A1H1PNP5_9GAMM|nr:AMP-binding protein [Halopseudomonas xinjiangensis]SDS12740.1 Long-chain acyl-CoA synthetase (AMP-forming) [Halopseudomonas xinjiangensis]